MTCCCFCRWQMADCWSNSNILNLVAVWVVRTMFTQNSKFRFVCVPLARCLPVIRSFPKFELTFWNRMRANTFIQFHCRNHIHRSKIWIRRTSNKKVKCKGCCQYTIIIIFNAYFCHHSWRVFKFLPDVTFSIVYHHCFDPLLISLTTMHCLKPSQR